MIIIAREHEMIVRKGDRYHEGTQNDREGTQNDREGMQSLSRGNTK